MSEDTRIASIISLYKEMQAAKECKDDSYNWLTSKCNNQSRLAQVSRKSAGIEAMALNTFKQYADTYIDGGFARINILRKELSKSSKSKIKVKEDRLKEKTTTIQQRLDQADRMRAILIKAYIELNAITLDAIASSPQYEYDYNRHKELYSKYFGISLVINNG